MRTRRLISQTSSADPSVTLFKLEDHDSFPGSEPESGLGPLASPIRRSKRVKVEMVNTEGTAYCGGDEGLPGLATKAPTGKGKGKGKAARQPPARTPSSESAASRKKPKAIKPALEKPHPAPAHWRGTYGAHQGDALAVPRASGHHELRHGQVEGEGSSGARRVSLARIPSFSSNLLSPLNAPYRLPSSLSLLTRAE